MKIGIGNDHAAVEMKQEIAEYLKEKGYEVVNYGTDSHESCNYPEYGEKVGTRRGFRGSGPGDSDLRDRRGDLPGGQQGEGDPGSGASEPYSAKLSRQHNNTNILAFGARVIGIEMAKMIVDEWLNAEFLGGRHQTRVDMIMDIENR